MDQETKGKLDKALLKKISLTVTVIMAVLAVVVVIFCFITKLIPPLYIALIALVPALMTAGFIYLSLKNKLHIVVIACSFVMSVVLCFGLYYLIRTNSALDKITAADEKESVINIYVSNKSEAENINDAVNGGYTFGILTKGDRENVVRMITDITSTIGSSITTREYGSIYDIARGMQSNEIQAFIVNEAYVGLLRDDEDYSEFCDSVKVLVGMSMNEKIEVAQESDDRDKFVIYVSGIDVFGSVNVTSRSDVNILVVVNNETKTVLLVSTPRDYYVNLSNSGIEKDKLTHAGIYGVDVSKDTLAKLYSTHVDYYLRMNFTGFIEIIKNLQGIRVYSDYEFDMEGYHYNQGYNTFSGAEALSFARDRDSFKDGDRQRGRNQMAVIRGVIEKMESSDILYNYGDLMDSLSDSFETSMPNDHIGYIVQDQIETKAEWNILSYSVNGTDSMGLCYSSGDEWLYVMEPDQDTVNYGKQLIDDVLAGRNVTQDMINLYMSQH